MTRRRTKTPNVVLMNSHTLFGTRRQRCSFALIAAIIFTLTTVNSVSLSAGHAQTPYVRYSNSATITSSTSYVIGLTQFQISFSTTATTGTVQIDLFRPKNTRSQFFAFARDLGDGRVRDSVSFELETIPYDPIQEIYTASIAVNADPATSLSLTSAGVYPVSLTIEDQSHRIVPTQYTFLTYVPSVGDNGWAYSQKLGVAPLFTFSPFVDRLTVSGGNNNLSKAGVRSRTNFLRAQKSYSELATLGPAASYLLNAEALENADLIDELSHESHLIGTLLPASLPHGELLSDTYVPTDLAQLKETQRFDQLVTLRDVGHDIVSASGYESSTQTLVTQSLVGSWDDLRESGYTRIVADDLTFPQNARPSHKPARIGDIDVAAADTSIMKELPDALSDSAQANYIVAALSVIALEAPSTARGLVLGIDLGEFSTLSISTIVKALQSSPMVSTITLGDFFTQYGSDTRISTRLKKEKFSSTKSPYSQDELSSIATYSRASESLYENNSREAHTSTWMYETTLSRSGRSVEQSITPEASRRYIEDVNRYIALPEKRTLTLTSRENNIPVTLKNTSPIPITVIVKIASDKLSFPEGPSFMVTLDEENSTIQIPIKVRTSGTFTATITLLTPEENIRIAQTSATIRSSAVSGIGIAITVISLLFLALWWVSHYAKSRKKPLAQVVPLDSEK